MKTLTTTVSNVSTTLATEGKKRILFANIPADGHFNPLTPLAVHLQKAGYEVLWYTGPSYAGKIAELGIPHVLFKHAKEVTVHNIDEVFPERKKIKNHIKKISFDICSYFIARGEEFYQDIREIHRFFPFDLLIADNGFTGISYVRRLMNIPVLMINVMPLMESSKDLPPTIMGMEPSTSFTGRRKQDVLRFITDKLLLREPNRMAREMLRKYGIETGKLNILDVQVQMASKVLVSGTPGFEYYRSDMSRHIQFAGPLLPYSQKKSSLLKFTDKIRKYDKLILVTQGTFEGDSSKLIIPALEVFKNTNYLVVVTTAGWHTNELRKKYPYDNCVIEDFIPFAQIMPFADVFISNGGYGGVLLSIMNQVPMVTAGIHEGKNEICARVGYFKLGINLKTERPTAAALKKAVDTLLNNTIYQQNVEKLAAEFGRYDALRICEEEAEKLIGSYRIYSDKKLPAGAITLNKPVAEYS